MSDTLGGWFVALFWTHSLLHELCLALDHSMGFGGKFGVQKDRVDASALGFDHQEKLQKHESQKGENCRFLIFVCFQVSFSHKPKALFISQLVPTPFVATCQFSQFLENRVFLNDGTCPFFSRGNTCPSWRVLMTTHSGSEITGRLL